MSEVEISRFNSSEAASAPCSHFLNIALSQLKYDGIAHIMRDLVASPTWRFGLLVGTVSRF
jgi:hypothetical protein